MRQVLDNVYSNYNVNTVDVVGSGDLKIGNLTLLSNLGGKNPAKIVTWFTYYVMSTLSKSNLSYTWCTGNTAKKYLTQNTNFVLSN